MKILMLTGRFGMGHYSVASTIAEEIKKNIDVTSIETIDIVDYIFPRLKTLVYTSYRTLVMKANGIYNLVYKNTKDSDNNIVLPFSTKLVVKMKRLIDEKKPDIIISTLPLCSRLISDYKIRFNSDIPLVTCITDISYHNEWISPKTNLYIVAVDGVKDNLIKHGVKAENIIVAGIPVRAQFKNMANEHRKTNKKKKTLLIMGGGLGLIPLDNSFYSRLSRNPDLNIVVIMGKNHKGYKALVGKYPNIEVIGYTDKVHEYMAKADLIISKSGGITVFEAIYSHLPLLVLTPFLEQERSNALFIEEQNIGKVIWNSSDDIASHVVDLIHNDHSLMIMRKNMDKIISHINSSTILDVLRVFSEVA